MKHRDRVGEALSHSEPDRCAWQATFTPEFAARLRSELGPHDSSGHDHAAGAPHGGHNPHGGGNPYDLEMAFGQDILITSVGWANSYYGLGDEYVDEWGVGWQSVAYTTLRGSPRHWRRFLKPRLAEIITRVKSVNPSVKVAYHTDGCVYAIVPELIEIGVDVLNPVQPAAIDPARLKREYGRELCFWGAVDEQYTLPFGRPDDVRHEVEERVKTLGQGGGFILAPTHHLQLDTPLENFWALVGAVGGPLPVATCTHG